MPKPLDPAAIMAAHARHKGLRTGIGESCIPLWEDRPPGVPPCLPYRLADALTTACREGAEQALREYAEALEDNRSALYWDRSCFVSDVREWAKQYRADKIAKGDDE